MRYALYFTPEQDDPLTIAAQAWLGRDAFTGAALPVPPLAGFTAEEAWLLTAEPRRYGFHATLVAPFRLRDGLSPQSPVDVARRFADGLTPFAIPGLAITRIDGFFALTPSEPAGISALASAAVDRFEDLRAPLTPREIGRRRPERLTARQRAYLDQHGYPYVKEEFRFHMTLTGALEPDVAARVEPALHARFGPLLARPVEVSAVALFIEPEPGDAFTVHSIHRFGEAVVKRFA